MAYEKTVGATSDTLTLTTLPLTAGQSYVGLGFWERDVNTSGKDSATYNAFTYGIASPASAIPRTGSASYSTLMFGVLAADGGAQPVKTSTGTGALNVDFANGIFGLYVGATETNILASAPTTPSTGFPNFVANGQLSSTDGTLVGTGAYQTTISLVGANTRQGNLTGPLLGRFYGPNAQQLGATFTLTDGIGDDFTGSLIGNQSGAANTNLTLSNIIASQFFSTDGWRVFPPTSTSPYGYMAEEMDDLILPGPGGSGVIFVPANGPSVPSVSFAPTDAVSSTNPNFTVYQKTVGDVASRLALYNSGPSNSELALTYTSFGSWQQTQSGAMNQTWFVYGLPTAWATVLSRTGSAIYKGVAYGSATNISTQASQSVTGTSLFNINFGTQQIAGSLALGSFGTFILSSSGPFYSQSPYETVQVFIQQGTNSNGSMRPQFYGPNAEEIGGAFQISVHGATTYNINGAVVAKR